MPNRTALHYILAKQNRPMTARTAISSHSVFLVFQTTICITSLFEPTQDKGISSRDVIVKFVSEQISKNVPESFLSNGYGCLKLQRPSSVGWLIGFVGKKFLENEHTIFVFIWIVNALRVMTK